MILMPETIYREQMLEAMLKAPNFYELGLLVFDVMTTQYEKAGMGLTQVCGPISTGGIGSKEENLKRFEEVIALKKIWGCPVFDQTPLEPSISRLIQKQVPEGEYPWDLLNHVYLPLLKSGMIESLYFLRGWKRSTGSRWEHEQGGQLGLRIEYQD